MTPHVVRHRTGGFRIGGARDRFEQARSACVPTRRRTLWPMFSRSSRGRLTDKDLGRFPDDTLFHRIARAVCHAGCLPRKELYETWEMARRVRRRFRGGRVIDLGGGHGLLAQVMLLLDSSSPSALVVDTTLPASSARVHQALVQVWPRLGGRVAFVPRRVGGG